MKKTALSTVIAGVVLGLASFGAAAHEDYSEAGVLHWLDHLQSGTPMNDNAPAPGFSTVTESAATGVRSKTLQGGSTLYVFKDGKMAMENRVGRPLSMEGGHPMKTVDGETVVMKGNELWRLQEVHAIHRGG